MQLGMCVNPVDAARLNLDLDYVEANTLVLLIPAEDEAAFQARWDEAKVCSKPILRSVAFLPGELPCVGEAVDKPAVLRFAETAFDRARRVGVGAIVFGSGGSRRIPEGQTVEQIKPGFIELLGEMGERAEKYGVKIALEPLRAEECNFINTVAEGAEIVRAVNHPAVRLLADIFHMGAGGESPEVFAETAELLIHTHIAQIKERQYPGKDNEDVLPYLSALIAAGYDGTMSIECRWNDLEAEAPIALKNLREMIAEADA